MLLFFSIGREMESKLNSGAEVRELRMSYGKFHVSLLYKCIAHI